MKLLLKNCRWQVGSEDRSGDFRIRRGRIAAIGRGLAPGPGERLLDLSGYLLLPGLINGHDHLGLNLLPHLGDPPYPSIYHFGGDVYRPEASPVRDHLRVAVRDRLWWGAYKNLISGVTTVVHHDPFSRRVFHRGFPVRVARHYGWAHSLGYGGSGTAAASADDPGYGEHVARAYRACDGAPFVVHAAEGVDDASFGEVDRLEELGVLGPRTVLVHAISLTSAQQRTLAARGVAVVWCPASNLRLYGRTAAVGSLRGRVAVILGTDSTLTGSPTLLDEMRAAAGTGLATAEEILDMVTVRAARIFALGDCGRLREGSLADLVALRDRGRGSAEQLLAATCADVELVVVGGAVRLARPAWAEALALGAANARLAGRSRWIYGDPGGLRRRIQEAAAPWRPSQNPVWSLLRPLR